jgi:hypothetical protein
MRVESFVVSGWEDEETGLIIDENDQWVLVKYIPVDYLIDGYKLYKKEFIVERIYAKEEELIEKVLTLKGVKEDKPLGFKFLDTFDFLQWIQDSYGLFEFQDRDQTELFYGRINQVKDDVLSIDMIKTWGQVEIGYHHKFFIHEIRSITFDSDYFNSIKLLYENYQLGRVK